MAGQATIVTELIQQLGDADATIFVPIGGGGLIAGIASACRHLAPGWRIIGVEPELEDDAYQSFSTRRRVTLPAPSTSLADAIKVQTLGDLTWPIIVNTVDDIVTVTESEIAEATISTAERLHVLVEPAAATAVAAAVNHHDQRGDHVVAIATGGNITLTQLKELQPSITVDG